ncbi:hypothetical protein Btru_037596 [Bulinus truncatus]|nr:hypothetical protein Btru_037596 [Bulinus truncatus]
MDHHRSPKSQVAHHRSPTSQVALPQFTNVAGGSSPATNVSGGSSQATNVSGSSSQFTNVRWLITGHKRLNCPSQVTNISGENKRSDEGWPMTTVLTIVKLCNFKDISFTKRGRSLLEKTLLLLLVVSLVALIAVVAALIVEKNKDHSTFPSKSPEIIEETCFTKDCVLAG